MERPTQRRLGRSPGFVNLVAAAVLTLLVTVIALRAQPSSPPEIAEFAPTAHQEIKQAPPNQGFTGNHGAANGSGNGNATPTPSPTPAVAQSAPPEVNHCVGSPPRQIEDPQSPPCVPFWSGPPAGATYPGVTSSSITVAVPTSNGQLPAYMADMATFFNQRFEFYGRKIQLVPFTDPGNHADQPPTQQYQGDAVLVQKQIGAFASLNMTDSGGGQIAYYDDLAHEGIISINNEEVTREPESHADALAPYEWNLFPGFDVIGTTFGQYVCGSLKGGTATRAGTGLNGQPRKFGILVTTYQDGFTPDISPFTNELNACGVPVAKTIDEEYDLSADEQGYTQRVQQDMLTFKGAQVTSVLCFCHFSSLALGDFPTAQNQSYFPEWVMSGYGIADWDTNQQAFMAPSSGEAADEFGLSYNNKYVPSSQEPIVWAIQSVDPGWSDSDSNVHQFARDYQGMLMLAAGIQAAGPDLTPQSFQAGLFKDQFPDPGADVAPYYQAEVGFGPSHVFFHSEAEIWWSNSNTSTWGNPGAFCWARLGRRHPEGQWPTQPSAAGAGSCY